MKVGCEMKKTFLLLIMLCLFLCGCESEEDILVLESCSECRTEHIYESLIHTEYYGSICAECFFDLNFQICLGCNEPYIHDIHITWCGYCDDCVTEHTWFCSGCKFPFVIEALAEITDGYYLCGPCTLENLQEKGLDGTIEWILDDPVFEPKE